MTERDNKIEEIIHTIEGVNEIYVREVDENGFSDIGYSDRYEVNKKVAETLYDNNYRKMDEVRLFEMQLKNGEIDMTLGSENFQTFINCIIQTFKQNGGKNFFTTTIECGEKFGERYALTIQKIGGKSPAEELNELRMKTAKEILTTLKGWSNRETPLIADIQELAERYGVEVE